MSKDTDIEMNKICDEIDISFDPILLKKTYSNGGNWTFDSAYADREGNLPNKYRSEKQFLELLEENGFVLLCSELSQIKFPIIDPFLKLISKLFGINYLIENPLIEKIRLISRVPIIGYYAIEVLCQKPTQ